MSLSNNLVLETNGDPSHRFHGLDAARAAAMLLGVFYHLPISMYAGGFGGFGFSGPSSPKQPIDDWLHSFRMPLFFLISGFFANMLLRKYGWSRFVSRRWWRIAVPLFTAMALLVGYRIANDHFRPTPTFPFGMPAFGSPTGFGVPFGGRPPFGPATQGSGGTDGGTAGPLGPPSMGGAVNSSVPRPSGPFSGAPSMIPPTGPIGGSFPGPFGGAGPNRQALGPSGTGPALAPATTMSAPPPGFSMPPLPSRAWSEKLFGSYSRHVTLEHLWFLWYLLVFVTIGPPMVRLLGSMTEKSMGHITDQVGRGLIRYNGLAFALGIVSLPALIHARNFAGWSLANPHGFSGSFPDFLAQYYPDQPFYLIYFVAGWWIYRLRDELPSLPQYWLWNLVLGVIAFAVSQNLSGKYFGRPGVAHGDWIRLGAFALYGVGTSFSVLGFLGFFERFLDRPTKPGRYLADTALWVYLVHLPLIPHLIWWAQPSSGPWWTGALAGMVIVTGVSLVFYELVVRPTPLVWIFGPASPGRAKRRCP